MTQRNKTRSKWVRKESYPGLFHARGWITGLGVAGLVAAGALVLSPVLIEPQVEQAAQVRLASLGFELQSVRAKGQDLELVVQGGPGTKNQLIASATALAQTTQCDVLGVKLPCAEQVHVALAPGLASRVEQAVADQPALAQAKAPTKADLAPSPAAPSPAAPSPAAPSPEALPAQEPTTGGGDAPDTAHERCQARLAKLMAQESIQFRTASTRILKSSYKHVEKLAQQASKCPGFIVVVGHTDNIGKAQANAWLSRVRAKAVRRALISRGLPEKRVFALGKGATEPVAPNDTPDGRAKNRRIEFRVVPTAPTISESTGQ